MGQFIKLVREDKIAGPLRRAFTPEKWQRAFDDLPAPDAMDQSVYAAGLLISAKLHAIRSVLKFSASEQVSATTKLRAFVAIANYDFFATREKTRQAMEKFHAKREKESAEAYALEEMMALKLDLAGGFEWKPDEIVESVVEGIELPIRLILQRDPSLGGNARLDLIEWLEVAKELNLGVLYTFAEDVWEDCLWNGYKVTEKGLVKTFVPRDIDVIRAYRSGQARRNSLSTGFTMVARRFLRQSLADGARLKIREVCGIERRGKRQAVKISKVGVATEVMEEIVVLRNLASEPYYDEILTEPLEVLGGLTISVLIDAWMVLSRMAHVLVRSLEEKLTQNVESEQASARLSECVPTLQITAIIEALEIAAGIPKREAAKIVGFFTFRGKAGQEIWAQPLIPVGRETVSPVFGALVSPNLRRLVDVWMRQADVDLGRRGPAFETYLRAQVVDGIRKSKLLSPVSACIDHGFTFRPTGARGEQIDLLFCIGDTLFLAEAKCILEPTDAKSMALHRKTVIGAAEQALRKAKAIEDHRAQFILNVKQLGLELTQAFKIQPLIVVSTATHVGVSVRDVPVIDEFILGRYIDGELEDIAYRPGEHQPSERLKTIFYSDAKEAEMRASAYFSAPPQLERFLTGLHGRVVPIYAAAEGDWTGLIATLECLPKSVPISLKARDEI